VYGVLTTQTSLRSARNDKKTCPDKTRGAMIICRAFVCSFCCAGCAVQVVSVAVQVVSVDGSIVLAVEYDTPCLWVSICCCFLLLTAAADSSKGAALPFWRRHYLLANASVQLEPCSAARAPRAWLASRPAAHGSLQLPGTAAVQASIYAHQHPADCSTARFLVYQHPGHLGLGALLDYLADALAWAWAEERVLLLDYPSHWTRCVHGTPAVLQQQLCWAKDLAAPTDY
jgi:hypothetical protein